MGDLVLICGRDLFATVGGSESAMLSHALAARELGLHPHLFSCAVGGPPGLRETRAGTVHAVRSLPVPVRGVNATLHRPFLQRAVVAFLAGRPGPHVIHGFGPWAEIARGACQALRRRGVEVRLVATTWTPILHEAAAKLGSEVVRGSRRHWLMHRGELAWVRAVTVPAERRAYRAADVVLINYESVRTLVEADYGPTMHLRRITYAPATAFDDDAPNDPAAVAPALAGLAHPGAPLIVSVSRHDGRKGLDVLLRALAALRDAGTPFRAALTGTGTLWEGHRALVAQLGLADHVALPGRVADVRPWLRAADVFVLPSLQEGSGSVSVLEALQAGTAVVSTDVEGLAEDLTDDADALLVGPGDVPALRDALARVLADPVLRARLGAAGHARFEQRFSAAAAAADLAPVYAGLGLAVAPARTMASVTRATSAADSDGPDGR